MIIHSKKIERFKECNKFINDFIVSLSVKKSILSSFENVMINASDSLEEEISTIKDLNEIEKLIYLEKYFPFNSYKLFVDIILLWNEQGGDVLKLSNNLLISLKDEQEYLTFVEGCSKRKTIEFSSLWLICLVVLFVLRFALTDFYLSLSKQIIYQLGVFVVFILALFSIELLTNIMTKVEIKGWNNEIK